LQKILLIIHDKDNHNSELTFFNSSHFCSQNLLPIVLISNSAGIFDQPFKAFMISDIIKGQIFSGVTDIYIPADFNRILQA